MQLKANHAQHCLLEKAGRITHCLRGRWLEDVVTSLQDIVACVWDRLCEGMNDNLFYLPGDRGSVPKESRKFKASISLDLFITSCFPARNRIAAHAADRGAAGTQLVHVANFAAVPRQELVAHSRTSCGLMP